MTEFRGYSPDAWNNLQKASQRFKTRRGRMSAKDSFCPVSYQNRIDRNHVRVKLTRESAESIQELFELSPSMSNRMANDDNFRKRIQELSSIYNKVS